MKLGQMQQKDFEFEESVKAAIIKEIENVSDADKEHVILKTMLAMIWQKLFRDEKREDFCYYLCSEKEILDEITNNEIKMETQKWAEEYLTKTDLKLQDMPSMIPKLENVLSTIYIDNMSKLIEVKIAEKTNSEEKDI